MSESSHKSAKKNPPEKKISAVNSGISVAIWLNQVETEKGTRSFRSVTIEPRRYFDRKDGEWKSSSSFGPADIPLLLFALEQARDYLFLQPLPGQEQEAAREPGRDEGEEVPY